MLTNRALLVIVLLIGSAVPTGRAVADVDFARDVAPILAEHCVRCHLPGNEEGDLSLTTGDDLRRLEYVVPEDPQASYLLDVIQSVDGERPEMPKEGEPLTSDEVGVLRRWIEAGARWPPEFVIQAPATNAADWWSLQAPAQVDPPGVADAPGGWQTNPIDAFVLQTLQEKSLTPSPPADRQTLLRRVTLDVTGLPPTPAEVTDFVNDPDHDAAAFARVIDRLLASPRYGERWAQHWLDVIRWAETVGFETNLARPNAWPYRDWVIAALNDDKPYNEFLFEQIAGDTVGEDAALGFLVAGPANLPGQIGRDESAMRQARQDELDEVIRTVSQAFFGLTIGCARCHNHKFDPITQQDYYSMQAIFAGLTYGDRRLRGDQNDEWTAQIPAAQDRLRALETERSSLQARHGLRPPLEAVHEETFEPITAAAVRMRIAATNNNSNASLYEFEVFQRAADSAEAVNVALASSGATPSASGFMLANQTRHFDNLVDGTVDQRQAFPWVNDKGGPAWLQVDLAQPATIDRIVWHNGSSIPVDYVIEVRAPETETWTEILHTRDRMPRTDDSRPAEQVQLEGVSTDEVATIVANGAAIRGAQGELSRLRAGPQVYGAQFADHPDETWLLRRGDPMQRSKVVAPMVPAFLQQTDGDISNVSADVAADVHLPEVERRLALARHLTRSDHPLTARVIVNRVWQHHFGTGLVKTPSDLGKMGAPPSHPELLDWLAVNFVEQGWSMKRLHRLILTSQTYQQSSLPRADALAVDANSRLLWRYPPRRIEAEAIRDSILAVSGKLNLQAGGPGFDFFNQRGGLSDYRSVETFDASGWRRMIYAHKVRMQAVDIFGAFDCPDAGQMKPSRTQSITPVQSLALFNSPFVNRQAQFFAERVRAEAGDDPVQQIAHAFALALAREPDDREQERLVDLANQHGLEQVCRVLFNTSEFVLLR